ncbi:phosphotransferase [Nocardia sp. NPDC050175]|uniref:phosphotransferase n=1 Tax=Nocardia sp. NPDC050175 TaxID=3364317 RepID=UPI00379FD498
MDAESAQRHPSRNPCWRGRSSDGAAVFVKFENTVAGIGLKTDGTRTFYQLRAEHHRMRAAVSTLEPTAVSPDGMVQIYPWRTPLSHSESLVSGELDPRVVEAIARDIARLHGVEAELCTGVPVTDAEPIPGGYGVPSLPIEVVPGLSGAQLAVWGLLHGDDELLDQARATVLAPSDGTDRTFIHGDLRLDQILLAEAGEQAPASIIDWESFGYGDPARDTGTFIGNILNVVLMKEILATKRRGRQADWQEAIQRGLDLARPLLVAFLAAYRAEADLAELDMKDHVRRALRFAGWHQFDRMLATAEEAAIITPLAKALAGVGRAFVLQPDEADKEWGLSDAYTSAH